MAEIAGKYSLFSFLPVTYTLTGNDRQGRFNFDSSNPVLNMKAKNGLGVQTDGVQIPIENSFKITRARIIPRGAAGLLASPNTLAGEFYLRVGQLDENNVFQYADWAYLQFTQWGQWENFNKVIKPFKNANTYNMDLTSVKFAIDMYTGRYFTCDDFNIQSDFVGQGVQALLELEAETAGMIDWTSKAIF